MPSVEELFQRHSVSELRAIEEKTRQDADSKKQELRLMVGERYRDVIEASDTILSMNQSVRQVMSSVARLQEYSRPETMKARVHDYLAERKHEVLDSRAPLILPVAALLKITMDINEQIWYALENRRYMAAVLIYHVGLNIQKELMQMKQEISTKRIVRSFPMVQHQWNALPRLKTQIEAKLVHAMVQPNHFETELAEACAAYMVIENLTQMEVLAKVVALNHDALENRLSTYQKSTVTVSELLQQIVRFIQQTALKVDHVFKGQSNSLLNAYSTAVKQGVQLNGTLQVVQSNSNVIKLGSVFDTTRTNVHVMYKYLPDNLRKVMPYMKSEVLDENAVKVTVKEWLEKSRSCLELKGPVVLASISNGQLLNNIKEDLIQLLVDDEQEHTEHPTPFSLLCIHYLGSKYSLWTTMFRPLFQIQSEKIIHSTLNDLAERLYDDLFVTGSKVASKSTTEDIPLDVYSLEKNYNIWLWSDETENADDALSGISPLLKQILADFNTELGIKLDNLAPFVKAASQYDTTDGIKTKRNRRSTIPTVEEKKDKLFSLLNDAQSAQRLIQQSLVDLFKHAPEKLKSKMKNDSTKYADESDVRLFYGKALHTIAYYSEKLKSALGPVHMFGHNGNERLEQIFECVDAFYADIFIPWSDRMADEWKQKVVAGLHDESFWQQLSVDAKFALTLTAQGQSALTGGTWEISKLEVVDDNDEPRSETIILPAHPSRWLHDALLHLNMKIQEHGGYTISSDLVLRYLLQKCINIFIETVSQFVSSDVSHFDEKCWLQFFLDYGFVWTLFKDSLSSQQTDTFQKHTAVKDAIRQKIDPIDYTLFESGLTSNIQRAVDRLSVLFNFVCLESNIQSRDITKSGSSFLLENHNLVSLVPASTRFVLLPLAYNPPTPKRLSVTALVDHVSDGSKKSVDPPQIRVVERKKFTGPLPKKLFPKSLSAVTDGTSASFSLISSSIQSKIGKFF